MITLVLLFILIILVLIVIYKKINIEPFTNDNEKIFVSVASYRDKECSMTLLSLFKNAKFPENIYVGVCEQNKDNDIEGCLPEDFPYKNNIRFNNLTYLEAKGPSYARYHCSKLYNGEKYFLQIDSHTNFVPSWDQQLIEMLKQCTYNDNEETTFSFNKEGSKRPVLTSYPPSSEQMNIKGFPEMSSCILSEDGIPIFKASFHDEDSERPLRSLRPFCAAGFMFLYGSFLKDVPYDPSLYHLFQGEEVLFSARLFTHGYDFFVPNKKICYHHYDREGPVYWEDIPNHDDQRILSEKKLLKLLNNEIPNYEYGLGTFRTYDDFKQASGSFVRSASKEDPWCFYYNGYLNIKKF